MAQVQKVRADENIGVINEILERDGCIVIENVLDKHELDKTEKRTSARTSTKRRTAPAISTATRPSA